MTSFKILRRSAVPVAAITAIFAPNAAHALVYVSSIVADGLDNPRSLAFDADGALYIAEGGTFNPGGPTILTSEGTVAAFGESGAITRVLGGTQSRVVTSLPSLTVIDGPNAGAATGPQGITFYNGTGYFITGLGAHPDQRADLGAGGENLASLFSFTAGGTATKIADLGSYELAQNPDGDQIDSNPFHLTAGPNGLLITDAGGNSLLNVTADGAISTVAAFPDLAGVEAVPTGVAVGPDGAFYLGQLTGFPFTPGAADIFRIDPDTGETTVFASGFTNITDIAFSDDGTLYVLQFADAGVLGGPPGSIQKLNADGTHELVYGGLIAPTGLEVGADGALYVTNFSPAPGIGQVLRIAAVPEPASWAMMIGGFALASMAMRRRRASISFG